MLQVEEKPVKVLRKISILLPEAQNGKSRSASTRRGYHRKNPGKRLTEEMSVSSYLVEHSRRNGGGCLTPRIWNDLAPYLSSKSPANSRVTPNGLNVGGFLRMMVEDVKEPWRELQEEEESVSSVDSFEEKVEAKPSRSPSRSKTSMSSARSTTFTSGIGTSSLTPLPVVSYRRPRVAVQNEVISFSDVPLLRRQLKQLHAERDGMKLRKDFARTTNDIYRMKLDRIDQLDYNRQQHFRKVCSTYLGTSPGACRALDGQMNTSL